MLSELFYWILNISIIGSLSGLIVLLLRKIKKLPRFAAYLLWSVPFLRLWIPFGIANQYSLLSLLSKFTTKTIVIWEKVPGLKIPELTTTNLVMAADHYFPIVYKTDSLKNVFAVASVVWAIVVAAAILASGLLYVVTKSELRAAVLIRDNIYQSDKIIAPAVYGIFRPKIIIPTAIAECDIDYILMHEQVHISRRDNLLRVIAVITACVHWFNPLAWIFLKCFFADMELSCDAKVLKKLEDHQTKNYASALLSCASGKTFFASSFGGAKTKIRIQNILLYKKLTALPSLFFGALFIAIVIVLITNAPV